MKALTDLLSNHFQMINSRLNTFCGIIKAMLLTRGINFKHFASEINGQVKLLSKEQSVSRFLSNKHLITMDNFYQFISQYFPKEKVVLSIDRTNWERGKMKYNIMVIAASFLNIAMPISFITFKHKGASTSKQQILLIKTFIRQFGKERIEAIVADREFDGGKLIKYLNQQQINFVIRVRSSINLEINNQTFRINDVPNVSNLLSNYLGCAVNFTKIKIKDGKYLSLISSKGLKTKAELIYKQRWDIECAFKGCKSNGFQIEQTHITNKTRFINLLKCLFISYAIAINTGWRNLAIKAKFKKTLGVYEKSVLQHGLYLLKEAYSMSRSCFWQLIGMAFCRQFRLSKLTRVLVT